MNPAEEYILTQPEPYRSVLLHVQAVIEKTLPRLSLHYKWRVPYYYLNGKPFCYLNVNFKKQFVDVGFSKGFQLTVHVPLLVADGGRNTIKSLRYQTLDAIDHEVLRAVLQDAVTLYPSP